jgi:thiosulfate dehydrogenase [quinone] large subunit
MENHREVAYLLLRITYGVIFVFYGIGKFMMGIGNFVNGINQQFVGKLPAILVVSFAYLIPFAETLIGALILVGLLTRPALAAAGLLLFGLTFGMVMLGQAQIVANNLLYVLVNFVLLWLVPLNRYSLDSLFQKKTTAGFTA